MSFMDNFKKANDEKREMNRDMKNNINGIKRSSIEIGRSSVTTYSNHRNPSRVINESADV